MDAKLAHWPSTTCVGHVDRNHLSSVVRTSRHPPTITPQRDPSTQQPTLAAPQRRPPDSQQSTLTAPKRRPPDSQQSTPTQPPDDPPGRGGPLYSIERCCVPPVNSPSSRTNATTPRRPPWPSPEGAPLFSIIGPCTCDAAFHQ